FSATDRGEKTFTRSFAPPGTWSVTALDGRVRGTTRIIAYGAATRLRVTSSSLNPTVGTPFNVLVEALDAAGTVTPSYLGTVTLSGDRNATFPSAHPFVAADAGQFTFSVTL